MQTNVKDLVTAISGPGGLNKLGNADLPVKMAYRIGRLLDSARSAGKALQKERERLFDEMGVFVKDPDGNDTTERTIPEEKHKEFSETLEDFMAGTMMDIWYEPVKLSELEACNVRLSAADMIAIAPFIDTEDGSEE